MNIRQIKLWLVGALYVGIFTSCNKQERTETNMPEQGSGKTVILSLSAEIGFEENEGDLKALNFKIEDVGGKKIPRPKFADGKEVEVHTLIRSNGIYATCVKTLKWTWVASERKLVLKTSTDPSQNISVPFFNNDGGRKWYIAGLLAPGTTVDEMYKTVSFSGIRELRGVSGSVGNDLSNLNIPYWFGWTELTLNTSTTRDSDGSYQEAHVPHTSTIKFKPLGSLIAFKFGNKLTAGSYTFSPTGFSVESNSFSNGGLFDFNMAIPSVNPQDALPIWSGGYSPMSYTFATGHAPGAISHNDQVDKVYYAWVMPHSYQPATVETHIMLKGTSSKFATPERDFTKTYYTDYTTVGKATGGRPQHGKVYTLKANATHRLSLPIEYAMEYNLAGSELLQAIGLGWEGARGGYRFSYEDPYGIHPNFRPHDNDQSGYYTWYELMGIEHPTYNPGSNHKSIRTTPHLRDIGQTYGGTVLSSKYFIPEIDHWWGILPPRAFDWASSSSTNVPHECFQLGYNQGQYYHGYAFYSRLNSSNDGTDDAVWYAIRHAKSDDTPITQHTVFWDDITNSYVPRTYQPLKNDLLRCAYRYTRVGGKNSWDSSNNSNLTNQLRIDVVHIGENPSITSVTQIANQAWWDNQPPGSITTRIFPATGGVQNITNQGKWGTLVDRGKWGGYWSASARDATSSWMMHMTPLLMDGNNSWVKQDALSVRLWKLDPEQP